MSETPQQTQAYKEGYQFPGKADFVRNIFAEIAPRYDLLNSLMTFGLDQHWRKTVIRRSETDPGDHVLDICTGTGLLARTFALRTGAEKIVGLDFCPEMIQLAEKRWGGKSEAERIQWVEGDAQKLQFEDSTFDVVSTGFSLRNLTDLETAFREVYRVLKPGGRFLALELTGPRNKLYGAAYTLHRRIYVPVLTRLLVGKTDAYNYLGHSVDNFPGANYVMGMLYRAGFIGIEKVNLVGGATTLFIGLK